MTYHLKQRIEAARGDIPPDLVLKGGRVINVFSCEILHADVAVHDGMIVGIGEYEGVQDIDVQGRYVCPGFMDGHLHLESSMLSPEELARAVLPRGTTAIVVDPHEIANVMGEDGIRYILESCENLPLDIYLMLPSCVPATHLETSGARLNARELLAFKSESRVLGLGEMMNYPGVVRGVDSVLDKIAVFNDSTKDGHAPLVSGKELNAYIAAGIRSDHECTVLEEAREKLRLGMFIMIREGTQAKNLKALLPLVSFATVRRCMLVTDDLHPHDLLEKGHLNHLLDLAIAEGIDPILAIQMVTLNPAQYFGFKDLGAIAPGYRADMVVLSSLQPVGIEMVLKAGEIVFQEGRLRLETMGHYAASHFASMRILPYGPDTFAVARAGSHMRVIRLIRDQIVTMTEVVAVPKTGVVVSDPGQDLLKVAVIERHHATGNVGIGFVKGFGLKQGALASSVAHDSHNIVCVGCTDHDMYAAVKDIETMGGGLAAANHGQVLAHLPLPIGGLMSDRPLQEVAQGWERMREAANRLGSRIEQPFMALSFLALPVIPELKITDQGLVDVDRFEHVPLFL